MCNINNSSDKVSDVIEKRTKVKNEKDLLILLDDINVTLLGYSCLKHKQNFLSKTRYPYYETINMSNTLCTNYTCYFSRNLFLMFPNFPSCKDCIKPENLITNWIIFLVLGLVCLLGNGTVIFQQIFNFVKPSNQNKEIQIYFALVLSLSLADIFMGAYLVGIANELRQKGSNSSIYFSEYKLCNAFGIISFASSQISLSTIILISYFRLHGVIRPYKRVRRKTAVLLIIIFWIFWIVIAVLPIIDLEPFKSQFNIGIRNSSRQFKESSIFFAQYSIIFNQIGKKKFSSSNNLKYLFNAIGNYSSNTVLEKAMKSFNIIDYQTNTWSPVGHYNSQYYCSINLIVNKFYNKSNVFTLLIVISNLISCILIIIAYSLIYLNVTGYRSKLFCFLKKDDVLNESRNSIKQLKKRKAENQKLFCTITVIVVTDVAIWFGMCLMSLINWENHDLKLKNKLDAYLDVYARFQSTMLCLNPINSILNPFIYFHRFWYSRLNKLKNKIRKIITVF